jgi:hypothetical protein
LEKHAIAKIEAGPVNGPRSRGTGFLVAEKIALTAFHVVADRPAALRSGNVLPLGEITLTFPSGKARATIHHECRDHVADFALLEIEWLDGATPPAPLPLALADDLRSDSAWETFGFPEQNPEGMVNNGTFSDTNAVHQKTDAFQLFSVQVAAGRGELVRGFSGAPVIVSVGQNRAVVGILRSALMHNDDTAAAGTVYACPLASVLARAEEVAEKRLPHPDPCFGLPGLPRLPLPDRPFKYLTWFREEDAEVFFGRNREIAEMYRRLTSADRSPIVLLYGQAGVGKSSFLDAGIQPRLKSYHEVLYLRRDPALSLLETFRRKLGAETGSLTDAWRDREKAARKPLVIIFDQLEEIFTHPNGEAVDELAEFGSALAGLFSGTPPVRGRLMLSFRKEWFPEFQKQMEASRLDYSKLFLQAIDRDAVFEAITGLTKTERLRNRYGLQIEAELAEPMASALLDDRDSPIAPVLQILLTKMWDRAIAVSLSSPKMTRADFDTLKAAGLGLGDFLDQQLDATRTSHAEWVDSGLALDVLDQHVTPSLTAREWGLDELLDTYKHRKAEVPGLVQELKDKSLLVDPSQDNDRRVTRLCHDTLGVLVRQRFGASVKPGQRARRILENRTAEWNESKLTGLLDAGALGTVEAGTAGMRVLNEKEQKLIRYSRRMRRKRRMRNYAVLLLFVVFADYGGFQVMKVQNDSKILASMDMRESVRAMKESEQGRALMLAISAFVRSRSLGDQSLSDAEANLVEAIREAREETFVPIADGEFMVFPGKGIVALVAGSSIHLIYLSPPFRQKMAQVSLVPTGKSSDEFTIEALAFNPQGDKLATCTRTGQINLWKLNGDPVGDSFNDGTNQRCGLAFTSSGDILVSYSSNGRLSLWTREGKPVWSKEIGDMGHSHWTPNQMSVAHCPDGRDVIVAVAKGGAIGFWDLSGNSMRQTVQRAGHVDSISVGNDSNSLSVLSLESGSPNLSYPRVFLWSVRNQNGNWNIGNPGNDKLIPVNAGLVDAKVDPSGTIIAAQYTAQMQFVSPDGVQVPPPFPTGKTATSAFDRLASRIAIYSDGILHVVDSGVYFPLSIREGAVLGSKGPTTSDWLKVACNRIRYHPIFDLADNPKSPYQNSATIARQTCQEQVWGAK